MEVSTTRFQAQLLSFLEGKSKPSFRERQLLRLLKSRSSKKRDWQLRRFELQAVAELQSQGLFFDGDWDALDWLKWGVVIVKVLLVLLALL